MYDNCGFFLQITSLEEFAAFVAIIRGEDVDSEKIKALTQSLSVATEDLKDAEIKDQG